MNRKLIGSTAILIALLSGATYVVIHRWVWLNDSQHSGAVQAATAIILGTPTLIFALFASVAALQSAEASEAQARAADAQAQSAKAQTDVSELQLEISRATLKEQTRPILSLRRLDSERPWYDWGQRYEVTNTGSGTAQKLEIAAIRADRSSPWGTDRTMIEFLMAAGQSSPILMRGGGYTHLRFFYHSLAGHRYISTFSFTLQGEMVAVYMENNAGQESLGGDLDPYAMSQWQMEERDAGATVLQ